MECVIQQQFSPHFYSPESLSWTKGCNSNVSGANLKIYKNALKLTTFRNTMHDFTKMSASFCHIFSDIILPHFQQYNAVPPTPLLTSDVLKEENELWPDVQEGMSLALREMRVDQVERVIVIHHHDLLKRLGYKFYIIVHNC